MNSKDYWTSRVANDMVDRMESAERTAARMSSASDRAERVLLKEIEAALRGIQSFGISEHEARTILNSTHDSTALSRLRATANRVKDEEHRKALLDAIESAGAYRWRIGRLETLNKEINNHCVQLYKAQNRAITDCLREVARDSYYHSVFNIQQQTGLAFSFAQIPEKTIDRILRYNWSGQSYSQRIWRDTNQLAEQLKDELLVSMLSGRSGDKTARAVSARFGANMYCVRRLVRTESAYVSNAAVKESYSEAGLEKYRFVATLDNRTSEACADLDGQVFELSKAVAGTNFPPLHPFCRSTTIAEFGDGEIKALERRAKDENGNTVRVPADMSYKEWYDRFVEGDITIHDNANENLKLTISERLKSEYRKNRNSRNALRKELEPIEKEIKELTNKVYFELSGTDEETARLRMLSDKKKVLQAEIKAFDDKILDMQGEYKTIMEKRLVDSGIFKTAKLPKKMTIETADRLEKVLTDLKNKYEIMPEGIEYAPLKVGDGTAMYNWLDDKIYIGSKLTDFETYNDIIEKAESSLREYNKHFCIAEKARQTIKEADKILSDKSVKGFQREQARIMKAEAEIKLNAVRGAVRESAEDVIKHEYAHFIHRHASPEYTIKKNVFGIKELGGSFIGTDWDYNINRAYSALGQVEAAKISKYAAENPYETFAEAFLAMTKGQKVPDYIAKVVNEAIDKSVKSGIMNMKGKMSNVDVRKWYIEQNNRIPELIDRTKPLETQARQACELRNSNRFIARELMADQEVRRKLDIDDPITTFEELVEKKMTDKGLSRDEAIADIVKTATKTRSSVNKSLGLEE